MPSSLPASPLPPEEEVKPGWWSVYRRPIFLVALIAGLVLFLVWLPGLPRATLLAAILAQRGLMSLVFLFGLIVLSLVWSVGQRLDSWVFLWINLRGYHPQWLDRLLWLVTQIGNILSAILLAGVCFLLRNRGLAGEILSGTLALGIIVETIKVITDRARPFLALAESRVVGWKEPGRSFPSGHTSQTFFLATVLSHQFQLGLVPTVALYGLAALVGFTRMYVGAHYPRDVVGGAVLGSIWGVLASLIDPYWFGMRF